MRSDIVERTGLSSKAPGAFINDIVAVTPPRHGRNDGANARIVSASDASFTMIPTTHSERCRRFTRVDDLMKPVLTAITGQ
jgi:hypothetical protein